MVDLFFPKSHLLFFHSSKALQIEHTNDGFRIIRTKDGGDPIPVPGIVFECNKCTQIFDRNGDLARHAPTHLKKPDEQPAKGHLKCPLCDRL